jgi:autophagy-related protein 13
VADSSVEPSDSRDDVPRPHSTSDIPGRQRGIPARSRGLGLGYSSRGGSSTSLATGGTASIERHSRYTFSARSQSQQNTNDDDEPLLFQMSEIGTGSRRSLEEREARGGGSSTGSAGAGGGRRGGLWGGGR